MRHVVRFIALVLLPVLVVTLPSTVEAATVYSDAVSVDDINLGVPSNGNSRNVVCDVSAYWRADDTGNESPAVVVSGACATEWDISSAVVNFTLNDGGSCNYSVPAGEVDGSGSFSGQDVDTAEGCDIDELCWGIEAKYHTETWLTVASFTGCVPFLLGPPPLDGGPQECALASAGSTVTSTYSAPNTAVQYGGVNAVWGAGTTGWMRGVTWNFYAIYDQSPKADAPSTPVGSGFTTYGKRSFGASATTAPATAPWVGPGQLYQVDTWDSPGGRVNIIGFGAYPTPGTGPFASGSQVGNFELPQVHANGRLGLTDPAKCSFYWGVKIASTADDRDEPLGPIDGTPPSTTPPTVDDPAPDQAGGCDGFSITDPSSWAGAGICMLVKLFGQLLDLIGDVLGKLGDLLDWVLGFFGELLDFLMDLFIPSDGFLDDKIEDLKADLEATAPGEWLASFTDQDFSGVDASGCSGIPVDFEIQGDGHHFNLLGACSGTMATTAGIVKLAASALLVVAGGLACLRGLGSGFGWSPSMGRKGESA